jgi:hypothetical protein
VFSPIVHKDELKGLFLDFPFLAFERNRFISGWVIAYLSVALLQQLG